MTLGRPNRRQAPVPLPLHASQYGGFQLGSLVGLVGVTICLLLGAVIGRPVASWGGILLAYVDIPSVFITIGGTFFVYIAAYTPTEYRGIWTYFMLIFKTDDWSPEEVIPTLVSFSEKARREGLLALEDNLDEINDDFLRRALQLVIDGTDPDLIKDILRIRMGKMEDRHNDAIACFNLIEVRAPAFGLTGTILGLIQLLKNLSDPAALGPSLAVALLTTFYGVIMANAFAGPVQTKLNGKHVGEVLVKNLMMEGILAIQSGDNPRIVEEKLLSFLSGSTMRSYMDKRGSEPK